MQLEPSTAEVGRQRGKWRRLGLVDGREAIRFRVRCFLLQWEPHYVGP